MNIDVKIERIDNGYVVSGKDESGEAYKRFYANLENFVASMILEDLRDIDKSIREHKIPTEPFTFKLTTNMTR